jgi:tetratricopeptide (TPR) repeat protein
MTGRGTIERLERMSRVPFLAAAAVFVLAAVVHITALGNGFVYDDPPELEGNPILEAPFSLRAIFQAEYWSGFQGRAHTGYYRPVPLLVQKILHDSFGLQPVAYHLTVILLHALLAALITEFLRRRCRLSIGALTAGALFAVHTANTESVACAYGLKEVLAALLPFSALFVYSGWTASRPGQRLLRLAAASLLLAAGLFSKESSLLFFLVLPAWDLLARARGGPHGTSIKTVLRPALLHASLFAAAVFAAFTCRAPVLGGLFGAPPGSTINNPLLVEGLFVRAATAFRTAWLALRILLLPLWQSYDYSASAIPVARSLVHFDVVLGLIVLAGLAWLVARAPWLPLPAGSGVLITATSWALASNVALPLGTIFSERFLYLPSLGLSLLIAPFLELWLASTGSVGALPAGPRTRGLVIIRRVAPAAAALALAALCFLTLARCRVYLDDETLARDAHSHYPANVSVAAQVAAFDAARKRFDSAEALLRQVEIAAPDLPFLTEQRAKLLLDQGKREEGLKLLEKATRQPDADLTTFRDYAERIAADGRVEEAIRVLSRGLREPFGDYREMAAVRELRGALLLHTGRTTQALNDLRIACAIHPESAAAWADLAKARFYTGDEEGGREAAVRALRLDPSNKEVLAPLAKLYVKRRDCSAAIPILQRLAETGAADAAALDSLGACQIAAKDLAGARATFQTVLSRVPTDRYALASLGSILESSGDRAGAASLFERFLASPQIDDDLTRQVRARLQKLRNAS